MSDWEYIKQLIGEEAAGKIMTNFAGMSVYVPYADVREARHCDVVSSWQAGKAIRSIALEHEYTEERVRQIIRLYRLAQSHVRRRKQATLFTP